MIYTFEVEWSDDDDQFVGTCNEYPSLSWVDSTHERTLAGIIRLVADVIEDAAED